MDDPVISFFPEQCPKSVSNNLARMTIHHLLSMNTGHRTNIYSAVTGEKDWVRSFLSLGVECEPGSHYSYNTPATYMLSAILQKATDQHLMDFLMPRLFEPLGIERPIWETCPMGIAAGGMGLSLTTGQVAKFGQMLLDKGKVDGKTVVSEAYVAMATREQSDNRLGATEIDSAQGYGYQFHLGRRGCFRGGGAFGQLCFVAPDQRLVIAATAALSKRQSQTLLDLIYEDIIDELNASRTVLPLNAESVDLRRRLAGMVYPVPAPQPIPDHIPSIDGLWYTLGDNPEKLRRLGFVQSGQQLEIHLLYDDREQRVLVFDFRAPIHIRDVFVKDLANHLQEAVTYVSWIDTSTLKLTLLYIETPYCVNYTIQFNDGGLDLHFHMNVSMTFKEYKVLGVLV
ncbi:serine hydrolase domain-containing protein [Paenibacillus sp. HJGM_3]|uniref:serine hydrolase domain-containing protein n=1 Tax=Paenibacillus sp. HJGM_3 TaxID=3379816 RepID=UPI003858CE23